MKISCLFVKSFMLLTENDKLTNKEYKKATKRFASFANLHALQ